MADLITELEIKKYLGREQVILPAGTILTPAAKDWAGEHGIKLVFKGSDCENSASKVDEQEKTALLKQVIETVIKKLQQNGAPVKKEELIPVVIACLERMGCRING